MACVKKIQRSFSQLGIMPARMWFRTVLVGALCSVSGAYFALRPLGMVMLSPSPWSREVRTERPASIPRYFGTVRPSCARVRSLRRLAAAGGLGDRDESAKSDTPVSAAREKVAASIPKPKATGTDPKMMMLPRHSMFPKPPSGTTDDLDFDETVHSGGLALLKLYHEAKRESLRNLGCEKCYAHQTCCLPTEICMLTVNNW